ncbi:MAG: D-sedoheptulose 7-phosphate isomerase [Cryomorphaceae bacterium]|nr:D-sedoheptulose 7-phosphate isomerase [Cryomorphaceae bacterium]
MANNRIHQHFDEALSVLQSFMSDPSNLLAVSNAGEAMVTALKNGCKIISCGNGGSMSDAMHFAEELSGRYRDNRPALAALSISDPTHMSCVGNDYGYDFVFSRYVEAVGNAGDVLLAISTSGNSGNVLKAAEAAKKKGMTVVGLTGKDGGKLAPLCDVECRVPWNGYADRIQEVHIKIIHSLIDYIELNV